MQHIFEYVKEHKKPIIKFVMVLVVGMGYYLAIQFMPFGIPCIFNKLTGLFCPGCGITHMIDDMLHLNFRDAARENLMLAILIPIWSVILFFRVVFKFRTLGSNGNLFNIFVWCSIALLIVFGILRNIPGFEFLQPLYSRL